MIISFEKISLAEIKSCTGYPQVDNALPNDNEVLLLCLIYLIVKY